MSIVDLGGGLTRSSIALNHRNKEVLLLTDLLEFPPLLYLFQAFWLLLGYHMELNEIQNFVKCYFLFYCYNFIT